MSSWVVAVICSTSSSELRHQRPFFFLFFETWFLFETALAVLKLTETRLPLPLEC